MHSSKMPTAYSVLYGGLSVQGGLCPGAGSLSRGRVSVKVGYRSRGVSVQGNFFLGFFIRGLCQADSPPWTEISSL